MSPFPELASAVRAALNGGSAPLPSLEIRQRAVEEGVEGLLASACGPSYRSAFLQNQRVLTRLYRLEMRRLDELLPRSTMVLKGAALLGSAYAQHPDWRPLRDLDLLPEPGAYPEVRQALLAGGYREEGGLFLHGPLTVDLHADLLGAARIASRRRAYRFPDPEIWRSAQPCWPEARRLVRLGEPHLFAYLCLHGLKHSWERLIWLVDLALLLPHQDPVALRAVADQTGSTRAVRLGLAALEEVLGRPSPWSERLPWPDRRFVGLVRRGRQPRGLGEVLVALACPSWNDRLAYLGDLIFPPDQPGGWRRLRSLLARAWQEWVRLVI